MTQANGKSTPAEGRLPDALQKIFVIIRARTIARAGFDFAGGFSQSVVLCHIRGQRDADGGPVYL